MVDTFDGEPPLQIRSPLTVSTSVVLVQDFKNLRVRIDVKRWIYDESIVSVRACKAHDYANTRRVRDASYIRSVITREIFDF